MSDAAPSFRISLEHVATDAVRSTFRLAFDSCTERMLLRYPEVTGLRFTRVSGESLGEWLTSSLFAGVPPNEFILMPEARIAFDLHARINVPRDPMHPWGIELPPGEARVDFVFEARPDLARWEALARTSSFASKNKPWSGTVVSNAVAVTVV